MPWRCVRVGGQMPVTLTDGSSGGSDFGRASRDAEVHTISIPPTSWLHRGVVQSGDGTQTSPQGQMMEPMKQSSRATELGSTPSGAVRGPGDPRASD